MGIKWLGRITVPALLLWLLVPASVALEVKKLSNPHSFIVDPETGFYYISNVAGRHMKKENTGFITRLKPDGSVDNLRFIDGGRNGAVLHAPKGILINGNSLYVADIDRVRVFDKITGAPQTDIDLTPLRAKYLSQMDHGPGGKIYVTETINNSIYTIDPENGNEAGTFVSGKEFDSVSGIVYSRRHDLFFVTLAAGWVGEVSPNGVLKRVKQLSRRNLVGLDLDEDDNLYVASFTGGRIYILPLLGKGKPKEMPEKLQTPGAISLDRKNRLVLVPLFIPGRAVTLPY